MGIQKPRPRAAHSRYFAWGKRWIPAFGEDDGDSHNEQIDNMNYKSLAAFAIALTANITSAQTYPDKPITIIIGSTAGSTTDGLARAVGHQITKETGQPVIVDSRAGAFGGIAAQAVARSSPDGDTRFITTNTTQAANPHLFKKLSYDPIKDFAPMGRMVQGYMLMVVNPTL